MPLLGIVSIVIRSPSLHAGCITNPKIDPRPRMRNARIATVLCLLYLYLTHTWHRQPVCENPSCTRDQQGEKENPRCIDERVQRGVQSAELRASRDESSPRPASYSIPRHSSVLSSFSSSASFGTLCRSRHAMKIKCLLGMPFFFSSSGRWFP